MAKADHQENHRLEVLQVCHESIMRKWRMMFSFFPKKQESYIKDTTDFVGFIENTPFLENVIIATLDV